MSHLPSTEKAPDMAALSSRPVMEVDKKHRSHLPIATQIGLQLIDNESFFQHIPFPIAERDGIPKVLATEVGMDPEKEADLQLVKNGIAQLREGGYISSSMVEILTLPDETEEKSPANQEHFEMFIQLHLLAKFEYVMRGSVESAQQTFSDEAEKA